LVDALDEAGESVGDNRLLRLLLEKLGPVPNVRIIITSRSLAGAVAWQGRGGIVCVVGPYIIR
jgi:hypothetical protein